MRWPLLAPEGDIPAGETPAPETETPPDPQPYDWHNDIHPDVKDDPIWKSTPDVKTLTKAYADATRYNVGAVKMPAADATADEIAAFHKKLGRPDAPEAYDLGPLAEDDTAKAMRPVIHAAGLTPQQWTTVRDGFARLQTEQVQAIRQQTDETMTTLKNEWGAAYDTKIGLVQRMLKTTGDEEVFNELVAKVGNHVPTLKWLSKVAGMMVEKGEISSDVPGGLSKSDAQGQLDSVMAHPAYLDWNHPEHKQYMEKAKRLFELVYN